MVSEPPYSLYQSKFMPFDLHNASAMFEWMTHSLLLQLQVVHLPFATLMMLQSFLPHAGATSCAFFCHAGLQMNSTKCHFACCQITVLCHLVSAKGIPLDRDKLHVIQDFPMPGFLRRFEGFSAFILIFNASLRTLQTQLVPSRTS